VVVHLALGFLLGAVLVAAGVRKLSAPRALEGALRELVPGSAARALRGALPACEIAVGLWLASGVGAPAAAATALILLATFSAATVRLARLGRYRGCGCFGEADDQGAGHVLARNVALALGAGVLLALPDPAPLWRGDLVSAAGAATVAFGLFLAWYCAAALAASFAAEAS
jgi:hypothetical protein